MFIEGFAATEINRIRAERFRNEADAWRKSNIARSGVSSPGIRQRFGDQLIRAGSRISGIHVDPCLNQEGHESPVGA